MKAKIKNKTKSKAHYCSHQDILIKVIKKGLASKGKKLLGVLTAKKTFKKVFYILKKFSFILFEINLKRKQKS